MAAVGVEEDPAVQAARILVTLKERRLLRRPEWVQKERVAAAEVVEVRWPLERWPKRPRSAGLRLRGDWLVGLRMPKLRGVAASAGSGACSSGEERERSPAPPRWRERRPVRDELMAAARRPVSPAYCVAPPSGSGPSTSADRKTLRPRHHAVEKPAKASAAAASVAATAKEPPMTAPSPETPLDFGASAAGSGASSSGDDGSRPPSKRRADVALGSGGGASSGDEGCSSPDKRARVDAGDGEKAISEPKMEQSPDDCGKGVKFAFDLNMPCPEDEECPGFC